MNHARFFLLWVLAGCADIPMLSLLYAQGHPPLEIAVAGHILASLLLFISVPQGLGWWHSTRLWALWGAFLSFFLPGVGWVLLCCFYICAGRRLPKVQPEADVFKATLPAPFHEIPRLTRITAALDFIPLVEILSGNDNGLIRGAIDQLVRLKTPEAIRILLSHRSDASIEVRYFVNSALSRIKNEFDESLDSARRQIQQDTYKVSARVFLAKIYLQYAYSGLLDEELERSYINEAIFHLTFAIESETPTVEAFRVLIDCYIKSEKWALAESVLVKARELKMLEHSELDRDYVTILYHTQRYAEIPVALNAMKQRGELPTEWQSMALWWGGVA